MIPRFINDERGSVLPFVALFLFFVAFGIVALVVDVGSLYNAEKEMVTSADAGALAGAMHMEKLLGEAVTQTEIDKAIQIAESLAIKNGADKVEVSIEKMNIFLEETNTNSYRDVIVVTVEKEEKNDFAKMIGFDTSTVKAQAVATWGFVKQVKGGQIFPLFMLEESYLANETDLHEGKVIFDGEESDPNRGYIKLGDVNGAKLIQDVLSGKNLDKQFVLNEIVVTETGQINSIDDDIERRMTDSLTKIEDGAIVQRNESERREYMSGLIPIVTKEDTGTNAHVDLRIKYFAIYTIYDVIKSNNKTPSSGSTLGFSDPGFISDGIAESYDEKFKQDTILGKFTGETVSLRTIVNNGDQDYDGDEEKLEGLATYSKLIK